MPGMRGPVTLPRHGECPIGGEPMGLIMKAQTQTRSTLTARCDRVVARVNARLDELAPPHH
jgi:hypothetical protein